MTKAKKFKKDLQDYGNKLDSLKPKEIYQISSDILNDKYLSKKLASGNTDFLKKGVAYFEKHGAEKFANTKYAPAMLNHIQKALPHQEGFIASKTGDLSLGSKVVGYDRIVNELSNIRGLSLNGLVGLGVEVTTDPLLSTVPGQKSNLKIVENFVGNYMKKTKEKGVDVAEDYLKSATSSGKIRLNTMLNILSKSYLPNLVPHINKKK